MLYASLPGPSGHAFSGDASAADLLPEPMTLLAMLHSEPRRVGHVLEASGNSPEAVRRLAGCVSGFRYEVHGPLVATVLKLPWRQSEALASAVLEFALELVSAVPAFNKPVIDSLVATWLPAQQRKPVPRSGLPASRQLEAEAEAAAEAAARAVEEATLPLVHDTLRGILRACPLGIPNLFAAIKEHLPHRRHELSTHVSFVRNTLTMLRYCHGLVGRVVQLLVERLVDLDVQIAQQLRALEEQADADDTIFEVESETTAEELAKMRQNASKLDTLLALLMTELVTPTCTGPRDVQHGRSDGGAGGGASGGGGGASSGYATSYANVCASGTGAACSARAAAASAAEPLAGGALGGDGGGAVVPLTRASIEPVAKAPPAVGMATGGSPEGEERSLETPVLPGAADGSADGRADGADGRGGGVAGGGVGGSSTPPRATGGSSSGLPSAASSLRGVGSKSSSTDALHCMDHDEVACLDAGGQGNGRPTPAAKVARVGLASASPGAAQASASLALEPPADPAEALFEALISAFRASVLPTYKCRCVQFLVFHAASFDLAFSNTFVQLLLAQLRAEHLHAEARIACGAYVASFLSRARFVPIDLVLAAMREAIAWADAYQRGVALRLQGAAPTLDVHLHGTFYTAVQGVLYVCCYRHEQLVAAEAGGAIAGIATQLSSVLHGPLNPLKFCLEAIVLEFERLGVCDIASVVTANERLVVASRTAGGAPNRLEDFFPFDPLTGFKATAALVAPNYQEWVHRRAPGDDGGARDSNVSGLSQSEDHSESLAASLQGMSVTPCSGDDRIMGDHMRRRLAENHSMIHGNLISPASAD